MKKRKIIILVSSVIALAITLSGCSIKKDEDKTLSENVVSENLKMISHKLAQNGANTKDGYYTISTDENGMMNIMYVDYKTKKQIYLCDKSQCEHDNDKCTSFIDMKYSARENTLLSDGKYLYLVSSEFNNEGGISTSINYGAGEVQQEDEPSSIYRMNLDGSNKKKLASLDSGELLDDKFFTDGNYLYGIAMKKTNIKIDGDTTYTKGDDYQLIGISIEDGERKNITDWDNDWTILGVYEDKLIVNKLKFDHELTDEERMDNEKYIAAYRQAKEIIGTYDFNTKDFEELASHDASNDYLYEIYEKNLFYYKNNGDKIMSLDLESKKEEVFLETEYCNIQQIYNGYIITSDWKESKKGFYIISIKDKKIEKFKLIKNNGYPINIIGESDNFFFVESNCQIEEEYVEWAGVSQTIETNRQYSMISKDDFVNNKKVFEKVEMIVEELN